MSLTPILTIAILSYNTSKITVDCIKSIYKDVGLQLDLNAANSDAKIPTEIIVVDNNSTDDSVEQLKKLKHITLIVNQKNTGFGGGNNQILRQAKGNYILFLNSDTIILHSAISQSLNWLSSHPEANICTAQVLNADKTIQATGGYFPNLLNIFAWCFSLDDLPFVNSLIKPFHPHTPQFYTHDKFFLTDHRQDWVTGAYMLVRKSSLDLAGFFDEDYFMYGEEVELTYRIHKTDPKGEAWYLIGPQIIHLGGASAPTRSRPLFLEYQGVLAFFAKHKPRWQYNLVKLFIKTNRLIRLVMFTILGKRQLVQLYLNETI